MLKERVQQTFANDMIGKRIITYTNIEGTAHSLQTVPLLLSGSPKYQRRLEQQCRAISDVEDYGILFGSSLFATHPMSELYVKYGKAYWCPVIILYGILHNRAKRTKTKLSGSDSLTFIPYFQFNGMYGLSDSPICYHIYCMWWFVCSSFWCHW